MKNNGAISTAKICAFARAYHSNVASEKVFDDFLATDLIGKDEYEKIHCALSNDPIFGSNNIDSIMEKYLDPILLPRTCFAENRLYEFAEKKKACQYVICGAGYDTFSFRNQNPDITVFEIDQPQMQELKIRRIMELGWQIPRNINFVAIDFATDDLSDKLLKAGFDPNAKTFFSILGVSYYLSLDVFAKTLESLAQLSGIGSELVFDYPDKNLQQMEYGGRTHKIAKLAEKSGETMYGGYSFDELKDVLDKTGFSIKKHLPPQEIQKEFFNNPDCGKCYKAFKTIHFILASKNNILEEKRMNENEFIFTSESVTEGHPDKVCDLISDSILDAYIAKDPNAHIASETSIKDNTVVLLGEISSIADIDIEEVVRNTINLIGYNNDELGFNGNTAKIINLLGKQSPDIAQGVNNALETRNSHEIAETGAGDQGLVFGFAIDETPELLPLPISLAHNLAKKLARVRKDGVLPYLRPDGKTQVSIKYVDDKPVSVDTIIVSTQHNPEVTQEQIRRDIIEYVIKPTIPAELWSDDIKILVNPTGKFVIGGPVGDSGLTGRKIIVDTYGGYSRHGGGAFSGKDPTKVDRSAAYAARYIAKNIVASGLASKAEIQIAYAIGVANPVSIYVNTFGTGEVSDYELSNAVLDLFDLRPNGIIKALELNRPIYKNLAAYGHVGREELGVKWEDTDAAVAFQEYFAKEAAVV
jgi:S-adenosylmethionine synthetase